MSTTDDFHNVTDSEGFSVINHNDPDFESYRNYQKVLDERFKQIENERTKTERINNLRKWDQMQPARWRGASLKTIDNPAAAEAEELIKTKRFGSFYIQGNSGVGKTYLSYAILRRYIGLGWITPSQIKIISEEAMLRIPQLGFAGRERFEELVDKKYKIYLFDSVGQRETYDRKREIPLWEQVVDHVYSQSLAAIFTSNNSAYSFSETLPSSTSSKLKHLIEGKEISMNRSTKEMSLNGFTEEEKREINRQNAEDAKYNLFDN